MHEQFINEGAIAYMLTGLYFPSLGSIVGDIRTNYDNMYESFLEAEKFTEYNADSKEYISKMNILYPKTYSILSEIMNETMH